MNESSLKAAGGCWNEHCRLDTFQMTTQSILEEMTMLDWMMDDDSEGCSVTVVVQPILTLDICLVTHPMSATFKCVIDRIGSTFSQCCLADVLKGRFPGSHTFTPPQCLPKSKQLLLHCSTTATMATPTKVLLFPSLTLMPSMAVNEIAFSKQSRTCFELTCCFSMDASMVKLKHFWKSIHACWSTQKLFNC